MWNDWSRNGHRMLSAEVQQELQALAQRHGLDITSAGGQYGAGEFTLKIKVVTGDKSAQDAKARRELALYGRFAGFTEDHYDVIAVIQGDRWQLKGYSPNRPKYPVDMKNLRTGKVHKGTESYARQFIAAYDAQQRNGAAQNASPPPPQQPSMPVPSLDDDEPSVADILAAGNGGNGVDLSGAVGGISF